MILTVKTLNRLRNQSETLFTIELIFKRVKHSHNIIEKLNFYSTFMGFDHTKNVNKFRC